MEDPIPVVPTVEWRKVPNRAEKRRLLKKLRRLPDGRTGRPWPLQRATGTPGHFAEWQREGLIRGLRSRGIDVLETIPQEAA